MGRHSQKLTAPRSRKIAMVAAPLLTFVAVGAGVAAHHVSPTISSKSSSLAASAIGSTADLSSRTERVSRSTARVATGAVLQARATKPAGKLFADEDLLLRLTPSPTAGTAGEAKQGDQLVVTGQHMGAFSEVLVKGQSRWVTSKFLTKEKPAITSVSDAPCPDGSGIEGGLQPDSVKVYRAVCAAFPELSSYGGQDGHGEHVNGEAIDFMVPNHAVGERVKDYLFAHRAELNLFDIIWSQHIWTIQRSGEGFRSMSDRGSATANHFDHVHIKINN